MISVSCCQKIHRYTLKIRNLGMDYGNLHVPVIE